MKYGIEEVIVSSRVGRKLRTVEGLAI